MDGVESVAESKILHHPEMKCIVEYRIFHWNVYVNNFIETSDYISEETVILETRGGWNWT